MTDMSDLSIDEDDVNEKEKGRPSHLMKYDSKNIKKKIEILHKYLLEQADLTYQLNEFSKI